MDYTDSYLKIDSINYFTDIICSIEQILYLSIHFFLCLSHIIFNFLSNFLLYKRMAHILFYNNQLLNEKKIVKKVENLI